MWTPRRLLLWLVGFAFFLALFQAYSFFLGHYDGLPPLPGEYLPSPDGTESAGLGPNARPNQAVARLIEAFGPNCEEQFRRIKLEWRLQGIVVAADRWQLLDNGQLRLHKVSVAIFGKPKPDQPGVEINTVRGEQADIEFDKPITDHRDAFNRKPVGGKLIGKGMKVELRNNRRTPQTDDDIRLYTDWLAYSDKEHRIWTHAEVRLVDGEPEQARVTALGLEVALIPGEEADGKPKKKPKEKSVEETRERPHPLAAASSPNRKSPIAGVKYVRLDRDVSMNLLIDARSAFLGKMTSQPTSIKQTDETTPGSPASKSPERTPLVVTSRGPFTYDVEHDRADFTDKVTVIRKVDQPTRTPAEKPASDKTPGTRYDQLDCDHLTLFFVRRRTELTPSPSSPDEPAVDLLRVEARGKPLEVASDAEHLRATGTQLVYDKESNETRLVGDPVQAERDGNELQVHGALVFTNPTGDRKEIQQARAEGRGEIRIRNLEQVQPDDEAKQASKPRQERVARWQREMRISKEGKLDRLDFVGQATFEDPETGLLKADQILVWMEERTTSKEAASKDGANRRPRRMDALNNVSLDSRELRIARTNYLRVQIEDPPPNSSAGARTGPASVTEPPWKKPGEPTQPKPNTPSGAEGAKPPQGSGASVLPTEKDIAAEPLVLSANTIDVKLTMVADRQIQLREVRTEGKVLVSRRPGSANDNGVEIRGDRLDLMHSPDGNVLKVSGQPAYVQFDRLTLLGPMVHLDQPANNAWVAGAGSMKLPTKTDFQGNPLQEPLEVTVFWTERMFFDGKIAEFEGNVQAEQGDSNLGGARLACQKLEVVLDRAISLKDPQNRSGEPPAGLHRMLCDRGCRLEKGVRSGDRWEQYQRIEAREVLFDNPSSQLSVYGPGIVTMLHEGSAGGIAGPLSMTRSPGQPGRSHKQPVTPSPGSEPQRGSETKLTRILFSGHMQANRATGIVIFTDRIQLTHGPGNDPDAELHPDRLPIGGLWLACNRLRAVSRRQEDGTVAQEFEASDRVRVQGRLASGDFSGQADVIKYVESKDLLILEGQNGNLATLTRQVAPGRPREPVRARRIWYWRNLNQVRLDETDHIQVNP